MLKERLKEVVHKLDECARIKPVRVISHHDTDGITAAAIFARALQRSNKKFTLQIVKNLDKPFIDSLSTKETLVFLDLASGSLSYLKEKETDVIILDHHEIIQEIPSNVLMANPLLFNEEPRSGAALAYEFAQACGHAQGDLATLAVVGMIGDMFDSDINKTYSELLKEADVTVKKGVRLYPATRPLDKTLEYTTSMFIPGVTGSFKGVMELLRDAGQTRSPQGFKTLAELNEDEMRKLVTAIMIRCAQGEANTDIIGNMYLVKFFNKVEDAREISAMINACSRMGKPDAALGFCLGNKEAHKEAEKIYVEYKQTIAAALKYINESEKITGKDYTIVNAQDKIRDTVIGTAASIMSFSPLYPSGTIIIAMAYDQDKIKISARLAGRKGRNVRELLTKVVVPLAGEVGGHPNAAGGLIARDKEVQFLEEIKKVLEIDLIKV